MVKNCPERLSREEEKWVWFNMLHATAGSYCMYWQLQTESISRRTRTRMEQQNQDPNPSTRNRAGSSSGSTGLQVGVEDAKEDECRGSVHSSLVLLFHQMWKKCQNLCFSSLKTAVSWFHLLSLTQMCLDQGCAINFYKVPHEKSELCQRATPIIIWTWFCSTFSHCKMCKIIYFE